MPKTVPLTPVPSDWLLRIVEELRSIARELRRESGHHVIRLNRLADDLEPTALMYVERDRVEKGP